MIKFYPRNKVGTNTDILKHEPFIKKKKKENQELVLVGLVFLSSLTTVTGQKKKGSLATTGSVSLK